MIFINKAFIEGVITGGLNSSTDIKILICYLLDCLKQPLSTDLICKIITDKSLANYFEIIDAISDLQKRGHLIVEKNENDVEFYVLSESGKETSSLFRTLPYKIKERALESGHVLLLREKNIKQSKINIERVDDGYIVECRMLDIGSDLLSIKIFVATNQQAQSVKNSFLNDPKKIYTNLLENLNLI